MLPEGVQFGMAGGLKSIFYMTLKAQILFSFLPFGFAGTKMGFFYILLIFNAAEMFLSRGEIQTMRTEKLCSR